MNKHIGELDIGTSRCSWLRI